MAGASASAYDVRPARWWVPWALMLPGFLWLLIKIGVLIFVFIWVRATVPRLRYDRLMKFGWKVLLPVATINVFVTAIVVGLGFAN